MNFLGPKQLKAWLTGHPEGKRILAEIMTEARMDRPLIAIAHSDHVDIFGYGPASITQYTAIAGHSPEAEILAEQIVETECKKQLYPHATFGRFGKIGTVQQRTLTAADYQWHQCMRDNLEALSNAHGNVS